MKGIVAQVNARVSETPSEQRAWPLYEALAVNLKAVFDRVEIDRWQDRTQVWSCFNPGDKYWEEFVDLVQAEGKLRPKLREATRLPQLGAKLQFSQEWLDVQLGYLSPLRTLARVLEADARRAIKKGDCATVYEDFAGIVSIAEHTVQGAPFSIYARSGWSTMTRASALLHKILATHPDLLSDKQLALFSTRIAALGNNGRFSFPVQADWTWARTQRHSLDTDDGQGDGRFTAEGLERLRKLLGNTITRGGRPRPSFEDVFAPIVVASRSDIDERANAFFAEVETQLGRPLWRREMPQMYRWIARRREHPVEALRYIPFELLAYHDFAEDELMVQRRDAALTVLALEHYRRQHAAWPTDLDALTPSLLAQVPRDRFDGERLRYRLVDGDPVLYSVGVDRDDDGGQPTADARDAHDWRHFQWRRDQSPVQAEYDGDWVLWKRA